tara:strand:- start:621 stop:914 length:294 start_codon:yes stop_codon:yes gene_type:complete
METKNPSQKYAVNEQSPKPRSFLLSFYTWIKVFFLRLSMKLHFSAQFKHALKWNCSLNTWMVTKALKLGMKKLFASHLKHGFRNIAQKKHEQVLQLS